MTTVSLATPRTRPLISWRVRKLLIGYSYLVPAALCMLATVVVPIILAIKMSLYADVLYKPQDYRFIGLGNYVRLVQDPVFWLTLWNSVVWVFGSVILQFVFGFAAALLLQQAFRGRALVRTLTLLQAYSSLDFGYAGALSVVLLVVMLVFTALYLRVTKGVEETA